MNSQTLRKIEDNLRELKNPPLRGQVTTLLNTLGYQSRRTGNDDIDRERLNRLKDAAAATANPTQKLCIDDWGDFHILMQVGDDEINEQITNVKSRFESGVIDDELLRSYIFVTMRLDGDTYTRTQLSDITRLINRLHPNIPVMVLFRYGASLTLAIINRRSHKRNPRERVMEKVTLIKDINLNKPHAAHRKILTELSLEGLIATESVHNFDTLHSAWAGIFNTEPLNNKFYSELFDWYKWAVAECRFPGNEQETQVIRLITRLLFVWFLTEKSIEKEKKFVPPDFFNKDLVKGYLKRFDLETSDYYQAILQNLFFATLNMPIDDRCFGTESSTYHYADLLRNPQTFLEDLKLKQVPFVNGGLFDCYVVQECFTDDRNERQNLHVPAKVFFDDNKGIFSIFNRYKFTIEEHTPIEQEVALDPELLGRVFEHLLAEINPDTSSATRKKAEDTRKKTGSYYTPRPIVDYMVEEALVGTLSQQCESIDGDTETWKKRLRELFDYAKIFENVKEWFDDRKTHEILKKITELKILDPAVGSGAFPMGVLHKLTLALRRLDPDNTRWEKLQKERALERMDEALNTPNQAERDAKLTEISTFFQHYRDSDFGRKLFLIQNSIFGVDIQQIACQIAKLRFFISLAIEQEPEKNAKKNYGIKPLPNLETRFIIADTLIGLEEQLTLTSERATNLVLELRNNGEQHFHASTRAIRDECEQIDERLRKDLAAEYKQIGMLAGDIEKIAHWNRYDQDASADWFDPCWMFGITDGFDVVIGNPPYKQVRKGIHSSIQFPYSEGMDKGKQNFYKLFVEQSYNLCKKHGLATLIVQSSLMCDLSSAATRQLLLEHTQLEHIVEFPKKAKSKEAQVFNAVMQGTCIYQFTKAKLMDDKPIKISVGNDAHSIANLNFASITKDAIFTLYPGLYYFPHIKKSSVSILEKIASDKTIKPLRNYAVDIAQGDLNLTNDAARFSGNLTPVLLLRGKHVARFAVKYANATEYCEEEFMTDKIGTNQREIFLICQQVTGTVDPRRLHFALTANSPISFLWGNSVNKVLLKNQADSWTYLALLNSKFMDWYFRITSTNNHVQGYELEHLPIPAMSDDELKRLDRLAKRIMEAKAADPDANTTDQEKEIDDLVYALYGLTGDDEIAIVEGAE